LLSLLLLRFVRSCIMADVHLDKSCADSANRLIVLPILSCSWCDYFSITKLSLLLLQFLFCYRRLQYLGIIM